ncbi:DUF2202 domain-containing protein [Salinibacterium sp. SWN1162]|uniref:DUF2202 domain-containing protein n=1 Tax=Salinibacterium sp. SWN1162 TaxID=2792053 RepID=UPI0018CCC202|nr:DUF2202 domain-containing protein [Salinibacterium sp. SWN1162]MBH0008303.1 DUF2202 domain-containing protein [Salinibacterium sp. SWN1162]
MRKATIITTSIVGGVVAVALIAGSSFAVGAKVGHIANTAGFSQSGHSLERSDRMMGDESPSWKTDRDGRGGHGSDHSETGEISGLDSGTLTGEQEATLSLMAEEEKVAHDLYIEFGDLYGDKVFGNIANAESNHLSAVQTLLERYELTDPTVGQAVGEFDSESMQELYDSLLAQGSESRDGAYEAARTVEKTDIRDLAAAADDATAPDVIVVYERLLAASEKHLTAFGG